MDKFTKLAEDCYKNVFSCLSFELSFSKENGSEILIFERHERSDGYFKNGHDILLALGIDRETSGVENYEIYSWVESDIGHMERW